MKILNYKEKVTIKKYIGVQFEGTDYLVTLDGRNGVRYISYVLSDGSLKNLPTLSIQKVFGMKKRDFIAKYESNKNDDENIIEFLNESCHRANGCDACKVKKYCNDDIGDFVYDKHEVLEMIESEKTPEDVPF